MIAYKLEKLLRRFVRDHDLVIQLISFHRNMRNTRAVIGSGILLIFISVWRRSISLLVENPFYYCGDMCQHWSVQFLHIRYQFRKLDWIGISFIKKLLGRDAKVFADIEQPLQRW